MSHSKRWRGVGTAIGLVAVPFFGTMACSSEGPEISDKEADSLGNIGQKVLAANAAAAPDPTETGPNAVTSAEYRFPAAVDPDVTSTRATELWARVYRPETLGESAHPLIVFLHGNHATCGRGSNPRVDDNCQYTNEGTCPTDPAYEVTPNHLGYAYAAERLASHGYVVVSINANRGINCINQSGDDFGFILPRGRLILKHLQRLSEWNANGGTPSSLGVELQGKLDFSQVGLMGHSRGGEGIRAAYNLYRDADSPWPAKIVSPVSFRALFEIGPVDGQASPRILNADGTAWSVLLPMCDGDVSNLGGIQPYNRMLQLRNETPATPKSTFTVWGTNHNFYNTEWQQSDSTGCLEHAKLWEDGAIGSDKQRTAGRVGMMGFFRANLGPNADAKFNQIFNPLYALPAVLTDIPASVDRGYTDSSNSSISNSIEDFDQATGTNSHGTPNDAAGITITHGTVPEHSSVQKAGRISWQSASAETFFQTNWTDAGIGQDISSYKTLDIRISRQNNTLNPADPTNLSIQLALADGSLSTPVELSSYADVRGPVGGFVKRGETITKFIHSILESARIPLSDFGSVDLTKVRGVRFVFDKTASGAIYLGNVRLSNVATVASTQPPPASIASAPSHPTSGVGSTMDHPTKGTVKSIRRSQEAQASDTHSAAPATIEVELETANNFPVRDAVPVLRIGNREFFGGNHPNGDTRRIVFKVPETDFASSKDGETLTVHYGEYESSAHWVFGKLDKSALK